LKQRIKTSLVSGLLVLALITTAAAGPVEEGKAARIGAAIVLDDTSGTLRPLAEQGDPIAQFRLASMYERGQGVPQDYEQAMIWYRKAADQGYALAQSNLGLMYVNGRGAPVDFEQSLAWFRKASDQGEAIGQNNLADMYENGRGVPTDYVRAYMWYSLAALRAGSTGLGNRAAKSRDEVAAKMTPAQIAEAQRMASEWKPKK
jgi:uncharacterized protein